MASKRDEQPQRIIQKITVTYRLPGDPRERERTFTVAHTGDGAVIDGLVWNRELVGKLAYREDGKYVDAEKRPSGKEWTSDLKRASDNCVWWHEQSCTWWELCGPPVDDEPT